MQCYIPALYPEHLFEKHLTDYSLDTILRWLESKDFNNLFELAEAITSMKLKLTVCEPPLITFVTIMSFNYHTSFSYLIFIFGGLYISSYICVLS